MPFARFGGTLQSMTRHALTAAACIAACAAPAAYAASGPRTERVSVEPGGGQRENFSSAPSISRHGGVVAYQVYSENQPDPYFPSFEVFAYDRGTGTTEAISAPSAGEEDGSSYEPSVSADGRFVAFTSSSSNLVPGDDDHNANVFVRDRRTGAIDKLPDRSFQGEAAVRLQSDPSISADGRFVAFTSWDESTNPDIHVVDRRTRKVGLVGGGEHAAISPDGRYVAWDSGGFGPVSAYVRDRTTGATETVSVNSGERRATGSSPAISAGGRFVAFVSGSQLTTGDRARTLDVFVRDRRKGTTRCMSLNAAGKTGNGDSGAPTISANGRWVTFASGATDLTAHDPNGGLTDVFVRDRRTGRTRRVSIGPGVTPGNSSSGEVAGRGGHLETATSGDGRFVAFPSYASNLVPGDTNDVLDVFERGPLRP